MCVQYVSISSCQHSACSSTVHSFNHCNRKSPTATSNNNLCQHDLLSTGTATCFLRLKKWSREFSGVDLNHLSSYSRCIWELKYFVVFYPAKKLLDSCVSCSIRTVLWPGPVQSQIDQIIITSLYRELSFPIVLHTEVIWSKSIRFHRYYSIILSDGKIKQTNICLSSCCKS